MKIDNVWVVTYPTPVSELSDIVFAADWKDLSLQFLGGLRAQDISGVFSTKEEAMKEAEALFGLRAKANAGDWSWSVDWDNGADSDEDMETGTFSGIATSFNDAISQISKRIRSPLSPKQFVYIADEGGGALFADVYPGWMNYNIMVEGPNEEILSLVENRKVTTGKASNTKGLYLTQIELEIISDTPLKQVPLGQIQSPGPVDYLFEYKPGNKLDPFVDSASSTKSRKITNSEVKKRGLEDLVQELDQVDQDRDYMRRLSLEE